MDIGSIFLILGVILLVALFISQPLIQRSAVAVSKDEQAYSSLLAERERILNALQELDFDHTLGKIPEDIYPSQRAALLQRGAVILRQIDEFRGDTGGADLESRLEAQIETMRPDAAETRQAAIDDETLEALIANRRRVRKGRSGDFCPQCGSAAQQADRFCSKCGGSLT